MTTVLDFIDELHKLVGIHEQPCGSNYAPPITTWYGMGNVPWCAETQSYALDQAGYTDFHYAYCPYVVSDAKRGANNLEWLDGPDNSDLQIGNLVLYCWDGSGVAEHIGCVIGFNDSIIMTIEGNTGGCDSVMIQSRPRNSTILGFVKITGLENAPPPAPKPIPAPVPKPAPKPEPTPAPEPKAQKENPEMQFIKATGKSVGLISNKISEGMIFAVNTETMMKTWVTTTADLQVWFLIYGVDASYIKEMSCEQLSHFTNF